MSAPRPVPNAPRVLRLVHGALAAGQGMLAIVLTVRLQQINGPLAPGNEALALPLATVAVAAATVARAFLRQRVPARPASQTPDEFWTNPATAQAAIAYWAVLEAGGLAGIVGYGVTGSPIPLIAGVIALAILLVQGPGPLEG